MTQTATPPSTPSVLLVFPWCADHLGHGNIQRLLAILGYDADTVDGVANPRTDAAIAKFIVERGLPPESVKLPTFFDILIDAAEKPAA